MNNALLVFMDVFLELTRCFSNHVFSVFFAKDLFVSYQRHVVKTSFIILQFAKYSFLPSRRGSCPRSYEWSLFMSCLQYIFYVYLSIYGVFCENFLLDVYDALILFDLYRYENQPLTLPHGIHKRQEKIIIVLTEVKIK